MRLNATHLAWGQTPYVGERASVGFSMPHLGWGGLPTTVISWVPYCVICLLCSLSHLTFRITLWAKYSYPHLPESARQLFKCYHSSLFNSVWDLQGTLMALTNLVPSGILQCPPFPLASWGTLLQRACEAGPPAVPTRKARSLPKMLASLCQDKVTCCRRTHWIWWSAPSFNTPSSVENCYLRVPQTFEWKALS